MTARPDAIQRREGNQPVATAEVEHGRSHERLRLVEHAIADREQLLEHDSALTRVTRVTTSEQPLPKDPGRPSPTQDRMSDGDDRDRPVVIRSSADRRRSARRSANEMEPFDRQRHFAIVSGASGGSEP